MSQHSEKECIDASTTNIGLCTSPLNKFVWNMANTRVLLDLWKDNYNALTSARRNTNIYKQMAAEFSNTFNIVPPLTGYQIQSKISNLRKQFRREKLQVGSSGGAPSKWWPYDIVAKIIGGEAFLDNDLLSHSQNFSIQDFQDGQIATMEDGKETVSILNTEALDDTSDVQSIVTIPDEEPTQSTSGCNKRRSSDDEKTLNKIAKTEPGDIGKGKSYWKNMESVLAVLRLRRRTLINDESITHPFSYLNLASFKLNQQGYLIERKVWVRPKSSQWFNEIFTQMEECEFKEHFRVNRNTFNFLVNELHPHLGKTTTTMREPISVVKRVAVALHYLALCEEYRVVSSLFGIGKSTANLIVHEVINAVNDILLPKYVKFPLSVENLNKHSRDFEAILGFPQCVGAVDGCHIPISAPKDQATSYYNYNGWYSIVLFAVVDSRYRFIYTSVGLPGRNNDSYILQNSSLKGILESNLFDKCCKELGDSLVPLCLIGDSAFPLTRHLLKPYPENLELSEIQKNFNKILCGARRVVENAFGRVKARFRVICKRMECDINFATRIVNACVTLHNICEYYDDIIIIEWLLHHHDDSLAQPNTVSTTGNNGPGKNVRDSIAKYLYERDK
ncbi:uncharacterized protein LOC105848991 isoform X2 [Hydra vulgaris]|uniref:uncharacterized protein LOC105848991 isoform X2 n=1 Tax=Hydra vulgaris TaxID=6087 RepID=UPI001F5FB048|nr:uncharacterized protein LOC105848991 isoform X2 [Hydra vulgaris]